MNGLKHRSNQLPWRRVTREHTRAVLFSKQRRRLLAASMSLLCLVVSLVQEDFRSFIRDSNAHQYTATTYLMHHLLNETVHDAIDVRTKNGSSFPCAVSKNGTLDIKETTPPATLLVNDDPVVKFALEPMWNCSSNQEYGEVADDSSSLLNITAATITTTTTTTTTTTSDGRRGRQRKLLFVHVFKTAGSTMRAFFQGYGKRCFKTGVAIVSQCSGLNEVAADDDDDDDESIWTNRGGRACVLQTFQPRRHVVPSSVLFQSSNEKETQQQQERLFGKPRLTRSFLRATTDVLIGHFPLGVHEHWLVGSSHNNVSVTTAPAATDFSYQYVVFFRDPLHKLVSGFLYSNRMRHNLTSEQAANELYDHVWTMQNGQQKVYHDGYSSYLLTPRQKQEIGRKHKGGIKNTTASTIKHNMALIKSNLLELRVMVGLVENMTSSMALLRHLIDGRGELTAVWKTLDSSAAASAAAADGMSEPPSSSRSDGEQLEGQDRQNQRPFTLNKSRLSTSTIARLLLERDAALLREHLRYEQDLYDFAMQIHERQYRATIMGHQRVIEV